MPDPRPRLLTLWLVLSPVAASAQDAATVRAPTAFAGTYTFILCHPRCGDSATVVGRGTLVVSRDSVMLPFAEDIRAQIERRSRYILLRSGGNRAGSEHALPNACFYVEAQGRVGDREYYPGIIAEGLTALVHSEGPFYRVFLYGSPDASFHALVEFTGDARFSGVGVQRDFDGRGPPEFGTIEGRLSGPPDLLQCFPSRR